MNKRIEQYEWTDGTCMSLKDLRQFFSLPNTPLPSIINMQFCDTVILEPWYWKGKDNE